MAGVLLVGLLAYPLTSLTIRKAGGWFPVRAMPVAPGDQFRVTWIHTVSNRPVSEAFVIDAEGRLCLKEMVFDHEGPGLPAYSENGTTWTPKDGAIIVTGYSRCLERLNLGISPIAHRLEVGNFHWDLVAEIGPDRLILVSVEPTPLVLVVLAEVL